MLLKPGLHAYGHTAGRTGPPACFVATAIKRETCSGNSPLRYATMYNMAKHRSHVHHNSTDDKGVTAIISSDSEVILGNESRKALCDSGLPDTEMCAIDDSPLQAPVIDEALSRGRWLLGLLILQSTSSFVLDQYQELLRDHLVVTLFLTMLVGAGGNAGNQSAIKVIRGLATGTIKPTWPAMMRTIQEQSMVGLLLGTGLSLGGFVRVFATNGDPLNAAAISLSLFLIVMTSVVLGSGLPFGLTKIGIDPANAGTSIQVVMDILGVGITCITCNMILVKFAESLPAS